MEYKGKIYQLVCSDGYYYIGSTKNELRKRFFGHKNSSQKKVDRKVYKHINSIGWDNVKIVLIEEVSYKTKEELTKKEYEHIIKHKDDKYCLNMFVGNTFNDEHIKQHQKHYYEENKDLIKERCKQYREDNMNKIKERCKKYREENKNKINEKLSCECGSTVSKQHVSRHKKTKKHINNCPDIS